MNSQMKSPVHTARALLVLLLVMPLSAPRAAEPAVRLAENGVARHAIVVDAAEGATPAEQFATGELALFLRKITGAAFPIVKEGEQAGPGIYVGHTRKAAAAGIELASLGDEEWVLKTSGDDLILTGGRPRGTLYAVYELLDAHAGCRWIAPDIEIVPADRTFAIPRLDTRGRPGFSWRETTLYPRHDDPKRISKEDYALFLVRNRNNGSHHGGGSFWLDEPRFGFSERFGSPGMAHTFSTYQKTWQDAKPEFFAMMEDGKRAPRPDGALGHDFCLTNPEVKDRVARQLQQYIEDDRAEAARKGTPPPRMYAFSQNDTSSKYCRCPECSAIAQREGSYAGTTLAFVNDVAARIADPYPDVQVMTEAYQFTKRAPRTIRPRENVVVRQALLDREYRADEIADVLRPLDAPTNRAAREVTEGWAETIRKGQFFVWDYAQFRDAFRYPYDCTTKILKNLEYWHRLGIDRVFLEQAGIDVSFRPMRDWLFFRKTLHPELQNEVLIDEYLRGYFGPAAGPMRRYYDLLARLTETGDTPYFQMPASVNPRLNSEFYTQVNAWLDEAEGLCQEDSHAKYLRHVQLERVPVDSGILHLWHRYAENPAWKGRKEEVLRRYEKNKRMLIQSWATDVHVWVNSGGGAFESELAALRMELPPQFLGRNANLRLVGRMGGPAGSLVDDSTAAGGRARRLGSGKAEDHKVPFAMKVHDDLAPKSWPGVTIASIPQDEAWHWHLVDTAALTGNCGLWSSVSIWLPIGWGAVPPPSNEMEVWVSLKFTGPTYVQDSQSPDQVLIDQVVIVPPQSRGK
ncbi:MAG: DUF4838 domain-containing protein [Planctomycetaceae bacterium]